MLKLDLSYPPSVDHCFSWLQFFSLIDVVATTGQTDNDCDIESLLET